MLAEILKDKDYPMDSAGFNLLPKKTGIM